MYCVLVVFFSNVDLVPCLSNYDANHEIFKKQDTTGINYHKGFRKIACSLGLFWYMFYQGISASI